MTKKMDPAENWIAQNEGGKWYVIGKRYIAEICEWGHEGEAEANAKAIAMLPEMLKLLREFVDDNGKMTTPMMQLIAIAILDEIEGKN